MHRWQLAECTHDQSYLFLCACVFYRFDNAGKTLLHYRVRCYKFYPHPKPEREFNLVEPPITPSMQNGNAFAVKQAPPGGQGREP